MKKMITKLPNVSSVSSEPLWIPDRSPLMSTTNHRSDYKGHFHKTKIPGPDCLRAESKKSKVSAYLSTLPLSPPEDFDQGSNGKHWLTENFLSKEVKWRRGNNLQLSQDPFDALSHYQYDYPPKKPDEKVNYVPKHIPLKTEEKFDSVSTYNSDFLQTRYNKNDICFKLNKPISQNILTWNRENNFPKLKETKRKNLPPLDTNTTYRSQFQYEAPPFPKFYKSSEDLSPRKYEPFNCRSNYQTDFNSSVFEDRDIMDIRLSSSGTLNKDTINNDFTLTPYLEYQRPVFYTVKQ